MKAQKYLISLPGFKGGLFAAMSNNQTFQLYICMKIADKAKLKYTLPGKERCCPEYYNLLDCILSFSSQNKKD